jgi:hypothetical protein
MSKQDLRFAVLIRVSTEKQERRGESLRAQAEQSRDAAGSLNGEIVATYAGQEHATPPRPGGSVSNLKNCYRMPPGRTARSMP